MNNIFFLGKLFQSVKEYLGWPANVLGNLRLLRFQTVAEACRRGHFVLYLVINQLNGKCYFDPLLVAEAPENCSKYTTGTPYLRKLS